MDKQLIFDALSNARECIKSLESVTGPTRRLRDLRLELLRAAEELGRPRPQNEMSARHWHEDLDWDEYYDPGVPF